MTVVAETFVTPGSSNIAQVSFDPATDTLTVEFRSGSVYDYFNVPSGVYRSFTTAPSAGEFFTRHVRNRYSYEQQ